MNFKDIGVIIAKKPLKENIAIVTVFTENHGLYSGIINEKSKKNRFIYQVGNLVDFFWQARLDEHIGMVKCELIKSYSGFLLINKEKLYAFNSIISLIKISFQERENHHNFFVILLKYLEELVQGLNFKDYINFELALLAELGYKLSISHCGVTGLAQDLYYVSPKSGRAVSYEIGLPYKDKLLILPEFLRNDLSLIDIIQKQQAFKLTSYFFSRYVFHNNPPPYAREIFIDYIVNL